MTDIEKLALDEAIVLVEAYKFFNFDLNVIYRQRLNYHLGN